MLKKRVYSYISLLICFFVLFFPALDFAQNTTEKELEINAKDKEKSGEIVVQDINIKEKTGVYVFIAWMWISIFVLFYIVRQKVKEVDRLYDFKFFSNDKMKNLF